MAEISEWEYLKEKISIQKLNAELHNIKILHYTSLYFVLIIGFLSIFGENTKILILTIVVTTILYMSIMIRHYSYLKDSIIRVFSIGMLMGKKFGIDKAKQLNKELEEQERLVREQNLINKSEKDRKKFIGSIKK